MNSYGKVSVIVPVYNAEEYLDTCVRSIVEQTYRDLEILLIDDGSRDQSPAMCDRWEKQDSRIKVIHIPNGGVSNARNCGMNNLTGDYLAFVDADDWINPCAIEQAIEVAHRDESDIVFWPYVRETPKERQSVHFFPESKTFSEPEIRSILVRKLFGPYGQDVNKPERMDWFSTVWGKLYRSTLIQEGAFRFIDLDRIGIFEDGLFNIWAFSRASTASYIDCNNYHYRRTASGQITSTFPPDYFHKANELYNIMTRLCDELGDAENLTALRNRIAIGMSAQALNVSGDKASLFVKVGRIKAILNSARYREALHGLDISGMPLHWKTFYFCCKERMGLSVYVMAYFMRRLKEKKNG